MTSSTQKDSTANKNFRWLAIGSILAVVANGHWIVPLATWLAPVFLVRFFRGTPPLRGLLLGYVFATVVFMISWKGLVPMPGFLFFVVAPAWALAFFSPYIADRLIAPRIRGFAATLVLPTAVVSFEYINAWTSPFGTWGSTAYTQYGNLPLVQLTSLVGIWGIAFLVYWFASVANWVWENDFEWPHVRRGIATYASILVAVMLYGGLRLAFAPADAPTVRIASITAGGQEVRNLMRSTGYNPEKNPKVSDEIRAAMIAKQDELFAKSADEAEAGAEVIFWSEINCPVMETDEAALIERAGAFTREHDVYLMMALWTQVPGQRLRENKIVTVDPGGEVIGEYLKSYPVPGEPSVPGEGRLAIIDTPKAMIAEAICFDMDFHYLIQQAGNAKADIIIAPSMDWPEIDPLHTHMAAFRAIENGATVIRQTDRGLSIAVDHNGQVLAKVDHYQTNPYVMISQAPTRGVATVYAAVGDIFAWASIMGFGVLVVTAIRVRSFVVGRLPQSQGGVDVAPPTTNPTSEAAEVFPLS